MVLRKITFEFPLKCEAYKLVDERSPYVSLLTCAFIDEDGSEKILFVVRDNNVEKFDPTLLERIEEIYTEEPKEKESKEE